MSLFRALHGVCNCGRNHYAVNLNSTEGIQVFFDDSSESRRSQASPLTAWLRVPLTSYHSQAFPFYPDETYSSIRKVYIPPNSPHCKRFFCGFCGTHLSYWSEQPREEAEFINITVGSLIGEDLRELEELGLLPDDVSTDSGQVSKESASSGEGSKVERQSSTSGLPWFEKLIQGSRLGRTGRTQRGMGLSSDGTTTVEWEVSEWVDENPESEGGSGTKRKIGETDEGEKDVQMKES